MISHCEITSTTSPTATVILTITSSQGVEVDLSQITITISSLTEITGFEFDLNNDNFASVTDYTGSDTTVTIPTSISVVETTDGETKYYEGSQYTVTSVGGRAFITNTTITNVVFPDTLQTIGYYAFQGCSNLSTINLGGLENLTSIGDSAFQGCTSLTEINIPDSVTYIDGASFENCTSLTEITIPSGVASIESDVFRSCTNLTNVTFEMAEDEVWQVGNSNFSTIYAELTYSDLQDTANNAVLLKSTYYTRYWRKV